MTNYSQEKFKQSKKSICKTCCNINSKCNLVVSMKCETDSTIGLSFVNSCNMYNADMSKPKNYSDNKVSVSHATDSRIEMMGGGH